MANTEITRASEINTPTIDTTENAAAQNGIDSSMTAIVTGGVEMMQGMI